MTRPPQPPDAFSPEESRYLDGEATPEETRRLKHQLTADPERAERLAAWRESMDVWREDAARASASVEPDDLADRILGGVVSDRSPSAVAVLPPAARWYAAAAVLLIALGLTGTLLTNPQRTRADAASLPPLASDADLEAAVVDSTLLDRPEFSRPLANSEEGR